MQRNALVRTAAVAALACAAPVAGATTARAGESASQSAPAAPVTPVMPADLSLSRPLYMEDAPARAPLMALLDQVGIAKTLDDAKINVYGFVEGSYTYSASAPPGNIITGRAFDVEHEDPTLNQIDLTIERTVDDAIAKKQFDVGARAVDLGRLRAVHPLGRPVRPLRLRRRPRQPVGPEPGVRGRGPPGRQRPARPRR